MISISRPELKAVTILLCCTVYLLKDRGQMDSLAPSEQKMIELLNE